MDLSKLYQTQISFTEWLQNIGHPNVEAHRKEDNEKRERLAVLNEYIGLPFDRPTQFPAVEIAERSPEFVEFLEKRGHELCALRLIPLNPALPKLRTRGASIRDSLAWFAGQDIDPSQYKADFVPHPSDHVWSTIFVVNPRGVFGQIVHGTHNQLTQGFYDDGEIPMSFTSNFSTWEMTPKNDDAFKHVKMLLGKLRVPDAETRRQLEQQLGATFSGEFLCGYFETVASQEFGAWFIDYNRMLGREFSDVTPSLIVEGELKGQVGSPGIAEARARVIMSANLEGQLLGEGDILVTDMTSPAFLPLMMKASAVVTAQGGILSHAAIVCRELGKPCVTNVRDVLGRVADGDRIRVDANEGSVTLLEV